MNYLLHLKFAHFIKDVSRLFSGISNSKMEEDSLANLNCEFFNLILQNHLNIHNLCVLERKPAKLYACNAE